MSLPTRLNGDASGNCPINRAFSRSIAQDGSGKASTAPLQTEISGSPVFDEQSKFFKDGFSRELRSILTDSFETMGLVVLNNLERTSLFNISLGIYQANI